MNAVIGMNTPKPMRIRSVKPQRRMPLEVVPADNKWFSRLVVAAAVVSTLSDLDLEFPKVDAEKSLKS